MFPKVRIVTDNMSVFKCLEKLHKIQIEKITAPVRWVLYISNYNYEVNHIKGNSDSFVLTDLLSRLDGPSLFPITFGDIRSEDLLKKGVESEQICNMVRTSDIFKRFDYFKIRKIVEKWQYKYPINVTLPSQLVKSFDEKELVFDNKGNLIVPKCKIFALLDLIHNHSGVKQTLNILSSLFKDKKTILVNGFLLISTRKNLVI